MVIKEHITKRTYDEDTGEEFARIRVRFETYKGRPLWSTMQLEGHCFKKKWLPIIRYDFNPKDKTPVHVNKEYISTDDSKNKIEFKCHPQLFLERARKEILKLSYYQIKELIKKREEVFKKEGK